MMHISAQPPEVGVDWKWLVYRIIALSRPSFAITASGSIISSRNPRRHQRRKEHLLNESHW